MFPVRWVWWSGGAERWLQRSESPAGARSARLNESRLCEDALWFHRTPCADRPLFRGGRNLGLLWNRRSLKGLVGDIFLESFFFLPVSFAVRVPAGLQSRGELMQPPRYVWDFCLTSGTSSEFTTRVLNLSNLIVWRMRMIWFLQDQELWTW